MPDFKPGDALRVLDASKPAHLKRPTLIQDAIVTVREITPSGSVRLREIQGLFRPHRFGKA